jgi:hypothetical protein
MIESLQTSPILLFLFILLCLFLIVQAVLWFLLPFAIFSIKDKLNDLIKEIKTTNALIKETKNENALIEETKNTNEQLEKLRALIVIMIKLQKDSKFLTKKSNSDD